ncbi:MBL fold metallo-hydrolase [Kutzneria kofuensis]|uniref:Glyoxylase-like metal-dependent hydrolase (Beta-lactamase superfamily II) n=1 Tax=Kutzneria kofuensis TaxID=103725 RepID=A0A7W9KJH6_9PSEU|nr:MBL fold metallo-hydrolase [Kutzneria kofuensis]MBB5893746.1 glyoxylase-like metal-dependent hydrolase (beta-lactamase superfamily II) [Kutzneria kofuensis]
MDTIAVGDVEITRVVERHGEFGPLRTFVPGVPEPAPAWLAPDHHDPATGGMIAAAQTWVLRSAGRTVLVDTGVGNDRVRTNPVFAGWHTDFLERLSAVVDPADVDVVVNTHVHADHVGWNTRNADGTWVPTFPNATYLIHRADHEHFKGTEVHDDSVAPVLDAGLVTLWENGFRIDDNLELEAAPGHTPGSAVLRLRSGADRAVFVGDMLHSPYQVTDPLCNSTFCLDPGQAQASRLRVLGRAADQHELVVPAHFGGHGAVEIRHDGPRFAITTWADFAPPGKLGTDHS